MNHWKQLSYSISMAVLLTALAYLSVHGVGEFLALPGMILEGWLNLFILMLSDDNYPLQINDWVGLNILFYSIIIYMALWIYRGVKKKEEKQGRIKGEI